MKKNLDSKTEKDLYEDLEKYEQLFLEVCNLHDRYPSFDTENLKLAYTKFMAQIVNELEKRINS